MKKTVSVILVLVMVLALGAVAFADSGIMITKNPTDEVRSSGGSAWFISGAASYNSLSWTFQAPDGTKYSVQEFRNRFPYATVEGENTTTLTIRNLGTEMNGYGVFCSFYNNDGPTDTAMAFLYVSAYAVTTTNSGSNGYVPPALYAVDGYDPFASADGYVPQALYAVDGYDPFASNDGYVSEALYAVDGFDPFA